MDDQRKLKIEPSNVLGSRTHCNGTPTRELTTSTMSGGEERSEPMEEE